MVTVEFYGGPADGLIRDMPELKPNYCIPFFQQSNFDEPYDPCAEYTLLLYELVEYKPGRKRYHFREEI